MLTRSQGARASLSRAHGRARPRVPRRRVLAVLATLGVLGPGVGQAVEAVPPMRLSSMTFVATTGPVNDLLVEATDAVVDVTTNRAELERVHARWTGDDGEVSLELTCDRGEFDLETNDFVAIGDVRGRLADGRRFEGPWVRFDSARSLAFTDAPVTLLEEGRTLRGGGFRYDVDKGRLRLTSGASVVEQ